MVTDIILKIYRMRKLLIMLKKCLASIKAEAYKEFAEDVIERTKWLFSAVSIKNEVDNLLKEKVGEDNA